MIPEASFVALKGTIRNPESGIRKPESRIQENPQDSAIRLYKNCLEIMSTQMLYFSIRDTRDKKI